MSKYRIDTQVYIIDSDAQTRTIDWKPGCTLFHEQTPRPAIDEIAAEYRALLERENYPLTDVRIVLVHVVTKEVIEVVAVLTEAPVPH